MSRDGEFAGILSKLGIETVSDTPDHLANVIQSDIVLYKAALESAGLLRRDTAQ